MNGFIIFGIMFMTVTGLENSPQSFRVYTVSQSRSVMTSAENPAPNNSPQSIRELRNGHVANLQELYYTRLVRKWRDIKFWYMCLLCSSLELQCVSLIDDAQNILNWLWAPGRFTKDTSYNWSKQKKNFHLIKYLITTFNFFLSFQSVLV